MMLWTDNTAAEYCNGEAFQPLYLTYVTYLTVTQIVFHVLSGNEVAEYCIGEDFQPRCTGNDVIVMLSARYGRMKVGRCVEEEPGFEPMLEDPRYLGCFTDVLDVVSRECSGRSQCTLRVNDQNFNNVKPCYANLKMYLEATYMCISGMSVLSAISKY